jgi:hypothetical protein
MHRVVWVGAYQRHISSLSSTQVSQLEQQVLPKGMRIGLM